MYIYEVRPRKDHRGVDLISDTLPFGRLWYGEPNAISNAIGYAMHRSRSHDAVIRKARTTHRSQISASYLVCSRKSSLPGLSATPSWTRARLHARHVTTFHG